MILKNKINTQHHNSGFTIVEVMVATVTFSIVMLVCAYAIMHIGKVYYKGVITGRTQDVASAIVSDVATSILTSRVDYVMSGDIVPRNLANGEVAEFQSYCVGDVRYVYSKDATVGTESHQVDSALVKLRDGGVECSAELSGVDIGSKDSFLGTNMRLTDFTISGDDGLWTVSATVSYGDESDFIVGDDGAVNFNICKGTSAGGQFCAVSSYSTTVGNRL